MVELAPVATVHAVAATQLLAYPVVQQFDCISLGLVKL